MPENEVSAAEEAVLIRTGLNVVVRGSGRRAQFKGAVTMGRGREQDRHFSQLSVRRFCLRIVNTIGRATRWAVFEKVDDGLLQRVRGQLLTYFHCLNDLGAFVSDDFHVHCDVGNMRDRGFTIQLEFQPHGCNAALSLTLHQSASGCRLGSAAFAFSPGV
jgi:phage tail sheath protein FI